MNERIRDLAVEAGFDHMGIGLVIGIEEYHQKFAQLIIAECVQCIKGWRDATDDDMDADPYWQGYRSGCNDSIVEINQHFGVEE